MKHISLGGLDVSRIGLGTMAMSGYYLDPDSSDAESIRTIHRALDLGVTHIDTAEIYGPYANEELVGRAIKGRRDEVVLATKFGFVSHSGGGPGVLDSSPANIRTAVEGSLKRLGTDHIDLYYQHRVDPEHPHRGHRRRPGRAGRRGQGPAHRPVRGRSRHDPPRPRRPPDHRTADRVLPVDPRPGGRAAAAPARAGHRLRPLLAARPRLPHRDDPLPRGAERRRLAQDQPALHRGELPAEPAHRRRGRGRRLRGGRHTGAGRSGLAARPGRRHRPDPRHQAGLPRRGEHGRRPARAERRADRTAERPHPGRRRAPRRSADGRHRPLIKLGPRRVSSPELDWGSRAWRGPPSHNRLRSAYCRSPHIRRNTLRLPGKIGAIVFEPATFRPPAERLSRVRCVQERPDLSNASRVLDDLDT